MKIAAPMFQGANRQVQAAWAHPVSDSVQWRSVGRLSNQNFPVMT